jgi:ribulose 1,5-bisphosphate synthetase/thiazole synthase
MKLVTIEMTLSVESSYEDPSWRGDARATIKAPVKYLYGVNLEELSKDDFQVGPVFETIVITIPEPRLLAVDPGTSAAEYLVEATGTRTIKLAGEHAKAAARIKFDREAREQTLSPERLEEIRVESKARVEQLAKLFLAPDSPTVVRFRSEQNGFSTP